MLVESRDAQTLAVENSGSFRFVSFSLCHSFIHGFVQYQHLAVGKKTGRKANTPHGSFAEASITPVSRSPVASPRPWYRQLFEEQ